MVDVPAKSGGKFGTNLLKSPFSSMTAEVEIAAANVWMANKTTRTIATGLPQNLEITAIELITAAPVRAHSELRCIEVLTSIL